MELVTGMVRTDVVSSSGLGSTPLIHGETVNLNSVLFCRSNTLTLGFFVVFSHTSIHGRYT